MGIFGSKLSNEYLLIAQHFGLTRNDLLDLLSQGIDAIFGSENEKNDLQEKVHQARQDQRIGNAESEQSPAQSKAEMVLQ